MANKTAEMFIRRQSHDRWPEKTTEDIYAELNKKKQPRGRAKIKPPALGFALLESIPAAQLDKLLTAASFKLKRVKRYPGWILQRTYKLGNRPIQII